MRGELAFVNMLEAKDIFFQYSDGYEALNGVSISVKKGEFVGLLGANGCGKTTFFMLFNGLLKPSKGKIMVKGKDIEKWRENSLYKTVGLVFQNPDDQLFAPIVYEDVSYGVTNMGLEAGEINRRVERTLKLLKMWDYRNRPVHSLSYGQKKRAAIAGILAMEPEILVLDEPTAGLDPMGVSELMNLLREIQKKLAISIVLSTHDIDLVPLYCSRVYVMEKGKIVLEGTPEQVFLNHDLIRSVNLRLPRIGHLMEILKEKDDFDFEESAITISQARKLIRGWRDSK